MDAFTVLSVMKAMGELLPKDNPSFAISDERHFIYYQPSKKIDLKIKPGDEIRKDTVTYKALHGQQKISEYINSNGFGIPYFGMSIPVLESGNPKGCITAILPSKPMLLSSSFLTVKIKESWVPIPNEQILYLEAQNRKTRVQSDRGDGFHKLNLSELEFVLSNDLFIRVHRAYIVNIQYIEEILPDFHSTFLLIMKDGSSIQVSQTYASKFRKALGF